MGKRNVEDLSVEFNAEEVMKEEKVDEEIKPSYKSYKDDPDFKNSPNIEITFEYKPSIIELSEMNQVRDNRGEIVEGYQYRAVLADAQNIEKKKKEGWVFSTDCKATNSSDDLGSVQHIKNAGEEFVIMKRSLEVRDAFRKFLEEKQQRVLKHNYNAVPQTKNGIVQKYGKVTFTKKGR